MAASIRLEVWGDLAAFNRPEMKVERVSYDVMTPSAARGILEAIYWKPQMRWVVDEIRVLRPIRFTHVRRNEISAKIPIRGPSGIVRVMKEGQGTLGLPIDDGSVRAQRAAMVLRDVRYGIRAHVKVLDGGDPEGRALQDPEAKHLEMFKRRARRGQYFHHPYLGTREFPAEFVLVEQFSPTPDDLRGEHDLGFMLHDVEFVPDPEGTIIESYRGTRRTAHAHFFHAIMRNGVIAVPPLVGQGASQ